MFLGEYQEFTNCLDVGCAPSREEIRESNAKRPRGHEDGARRGCCERAKEDSYTFVRWWYVVHSPVSIYFEADRRRFDEWTRLWIPRFRCFRGIRSKRQRWCRAMINSSFVANGFFSFFFRPSFNNSPDIRANISPKEIFLAILNNRDENLWKNKFGVKVAKSVKVKKKKKDVTTFFMSI